MPRNTRENLSIPGNVSDRQHARRDPDELITQWLNKFGNPIGNRWWCWGFWEKKELRIVGAKNHCNRYFYFAFHKERGENVLTTNKSYVYYQPCLRYLDLYSSGMTIPSNLSSKMHVQNSLTNAISELDREFPSRSSRKGSQQKERAKNSYTERKTEECFLRKTIWSWSRRDACSFLHTHATGDREDNVEWSGETQEILTWSKHTLQHRKWRNRLTGKAWTV